MSGPRAASGPVIPNFGQGTACLRHNHWFCPSWVRAHWGDTLQPALVQHVYLMLIAVGIGFGISFTLALVAFRFGWLRGPLGAAGDFVYCLPSIALFTILVPITGITVTTIVIPLVAYTLFVLYPNILGGLRGVPPEVLESARGMGLTRTQTFMRVELPLAVPAIMAGLRVATVSTIVHRDDRARSSSTTASAAPIFDALDEPDIFRTELLAAGALAILLALVADGLLALLQRALTPWNRMPLIVASLFVDALRFIPDNAAPAARRRRSRQPSSRSRRSASRSCSPCRSGSGSATGIAGCSSRSACRRSAGRCRASLSSASSSPGSASASGTSPPRSSCSGSRRSSRTPTSPSTASIETWSRRRGAWA